MIRRHCLHVREAPSAIKEVPEPHERVNNVDVFIRTLPKAVDSLHTAGGLSPRQDKNDTPSQKMKTIHPKEHRADVC